VDKVLNIAKTITTLKIKLPASGKTMTKTILLTAKHKTIELLFDKNFWKKFLEWRIVEVWKGVFFQKKRD
jgi:hypothetical protein